jgi:beta-lactam-binding protein with PASTA domain/tRNA A-37 threonylcarbamoyl transferase component Bud32
LANSNNDGDNGGRALNGRYQLISVVGGGGMAQVYKARDNVLGRIVAVKLLREQYTGDSQFVVRFKREAQAAANLAHPNIVNVYDVGQDGDLYYIVMEYIAGASLKEVITSSGPFPANKATSIAIQILAGIEYAHRNGLIHRDIKPQNVLIGPDGTVKVTDFGIAKSVSDLGLTEAGLALGTAHYFSPEQAKGERVVPASDIYALGVTLYEMLTGKLPFESDSVMGLAYKHLSEPPKPPRELNPSVPARLEAIVMKALAKDPNERFASAAEMEKALRSMLAGGQQATVEVPVARHNIVPPGGRQGSRGRQTSRLGGQGTATGALTTGPIPGGGYPVTAGVGAGGVGSAVRPMASTLSGPGSMAMRRSDVQAQARGSGCSAVAVAIVVLGLLVGIVLGAIWLVPQLQSVFREYVVPTPTNTPIIPTATYTPTRVPPTSTSTATATNTATSTATPGSTAVPKLVGLKIGDAAILAKQRGFVLVELERIDAPEWPVGVVAQQDPAPDTIYKQTSTISVRVSKGPPPFKMPPLANTDPQAARAALESTGLKVQVVLEGSKEIPEGVVIRTEPEADTSVRPGDSVKLVVSIGEVVEVPDLAGMENIDIARQRLETVGLTLGEVAEVDDPTGSVPPGAVLTQDPVKGKTVRMGTSVNVQIRRKE